jgi:hypothetical protein
LVLVEDKQGKVAFNPVVLTFEPRNMTPPRDPASIPVDYEGLPGPGISKKCALGCCLAPGYYGGNLDHCSVRCFPAFGKGCNGPGLVIFWANAANIIMDDVAGGAYYHDNKHNISWTFETSKYIHKKIAKSSKTVVWEIFLPGCLLRILVIIAMILC